MATLKELNNQLYAKAVEEQEEYQKQLLSKSKEEILRHCYEYALREDIISELGEMELPEKECNALLKTTNLLDKIVRDYEKAETDHMETLGIVIENHSKETVRKNTIERD